jgi:hypothetical protein
MPDERRTDPRPDRERFLRQEAGLWLLAVVEFGEVPAIIVDRVLRRARGAPIMTATTVHVFAADLVLSGSYEPVGDVLYLSAPEDDKRGPAQETAEGHAVRLDAEGRITHVTAINAKWLLDRDGELIATLKDGRRLRLGRQDVIDLIS